MQTTFSDLVGAAGAISAAESLADMEREDLARELAGLAPTIEAAESAAGLAPQAREAGFTVVTCIRCLSARDASDALPTQGAIICNRAGGGLALQVGEASPSFSMGCLDQTDLSHLAGESATTGSYCGVSAAICITDEGPGHQTGEATVAAMTPASPCLSDEMAEVSAEASAASNSHVSTPCLCIATGRH